MVVPPGAVKEPPAAQYGAVSEVQPQVVGQVALGALPARGRYLHAVVQLSQVYCVTAGDRGRY